MAANYKQAGADLDTLFDPYVQGTKPAATGYKVAGQDLSDRYAPISFGTKRADVGLKASGVDVSNLFAQFGSAVYFPANITANSASATGLARNASIGIAVKTNGTVVVTTVGTSGTIGAGTYTYGVSSAAFDFRIFGTANGERNSSAGPGTLTGKGGVSFTAAATPGNTAGFDTGWQASADDAANFISVACASGANTGLCHISGPLTIQVRRKSDLVVVMTMTTNFDCSSDSQS